MARVLVVHAHPYPRRSRAGKALLRAIADVPGLEVRSLYDRYPDFAIDVEDEQAALRDARVVVWQSPFYWYGVPSLLVHWFEKVLTEGFAHGPAGDALIGKPLLWATTTGTARTDYEPAAMHHHRFAEFVPPVEETARFCGAEWQPPFVIHSAHAIGDDELGARAQEYKRRIEELAP